MGFAVHTVLLLTLLYTNLPRAQNLKIAPNIPSSSENEVISSNDNFQSSSQPPTELDSVSPHDGLMCANVSMWSDVYWTAENVTVCACEIETIEIEEVKQVLEYLP